MLDDKINSPRKLTVPGRYGRSIDVKKDSTSLFEILRVDNVATFGQLTPMILITIYLHHIRGYTLGGFNPA